MFGSSTMTLRISNVEINDSMRIIISSKESGLFIKGVSETIRNETKQQKGWFLGMVLDTLGASLLGNLLAGKRVMTAGEGTTRPGLSF